MVHVGNMVAESVQIFEAESSESRSSSTRDFRTHSGWEAFKKEPQKENITSAYSRVLERCSPYAKIRINVGVGMNK